MISSPVRICTLDDCGKIIKLRCSHAECTRIYNLPKQVEKIMFSLPSPTLDSHRLHMEEQAKKYDWRSAGSAHASIYEAVSVAIGHILYCSIVDCSKP